MKKDLIGIFDSGIGGVTVLKEIIKILPNEKYIYYSDSKNNPYGDKEDEKILKICDDICKKFLDMGCKAIVIACNTASAKVASFLRKKHKDEIILAIEPAYKMVYDYAHDKSTLVMATTGTIESEKFNELYSKYNNGKTYLLPCSGLANIIEEGNTNKIQKYLEENLADYKGKVENVVLGCTHYPLIKNKICLVIGNVTFFDGSKGIANHLKEVLIEKELLNDCKNGSIEFIDSSNSKEKEKRFFEILEGKDENWY